jgi:hypothetical protein
MQLTEKLLTTLVLQPGEKDKIFFDNAVTGFGLRIRESGTRTWIYQYNIGAKIRRMTIGQASAIKLAKAREIAGGHQAKVRLGGDPAAEKRAAVVRANHALIALAERYLDFQKDQLRKSSLSEVTRYLLVHAKPLHEPVLNHASGHKGGLAGIYNRASYAAEKASALVRWDAHVASVIAGRRGAVTPLRARA